MASLGEMRAEHDQMEWDDPNRVALETEINKREQWCIDNKPEYNVTLTIWSQVMGGGNPDYPWHTGYVKLKDLGMCGDLNGSGLNYNTDQSIHHCPKCANI